MEERLAVLEEEHYPDVDFSGASYEITLSDTTYTCTLSGAYVPPSVNGQFVTGIRLSGSGGTVDSSISVPLETSDSVTFQFTSESNNTSSLTFMLLSSGEPISGGTFVVSGTSYVHVTILGYTINEGVSDPGDAVTYTDDCAGWTPMSMSNGVLSAGSWATESAGQALLNSIKPVVRRSNGTYEDLDKRNPSNLVSGGSANLTTLGNDFLVYFASTFQWLSISKSGNIVTVKYATVKVDDTYHNYAFLGNDGQAKEGFSIGAVYAQSSSNNLYSSPESASPEQISLINAVNYAENRGATADIATWDMKTYITGLFPLLFKTLNGQAHMWGNNGDGSESQNTVLTFTNDHGMNGTTANQTSRMAFLWIHDFWGGYKWWVGGMKINSTSYNIMVQHGARSSASESAFTNTGIGTSGLQDGPIDKMCATNTEVGFVPLNDNGSYTTHYCDYGHVAASNFPAVGGSRYASGDAGPFCVEFADRTSVSSAVRLSFKEGRA